MKNIREFLPAVAGAVSLTLSGMGFAGSLETDGLIVNDKADFHNTVELKRITAQGSIPTNGLVLHYSFTNIMGSSLIDDSGGGHTGTIYGATAVPSGKVGGYMRFDGQNDYVEVQHAADLNPTNISLAAWFWPMTGGFSTAKPIVQKAYTQHVSPYYQYAVFYYRNGATEYLQFSISVGTPSAPTYKTLLVYNSGVTMDTWNHVAATYDGDVMRLYLNRVEIGVNAEPNGPVTGWSTKVNVGAFPNLPRDYRYCFAGSIDELLIYNRALTASEISNEIYPYCFGTTANTDLKVVDGTAAFCGGIKYVAPLGDVGMGVYTNGCETP